MAQIQITDLTNKDIGVPGTGTFDLMMESINLQLKDQYDAGRIPGDLYADVYLGALQATLQESVKFLLSKQEADKKADLVNAQINEVSERIDLVVAQTAEAYEKIKSSQDRTIRENTLNNSNLAKLVEETDLLKSKDIEEIASTARQDSESKAKIHNLNADLSVKAQQEFNLKDKNGGALSTYTYYVDGVSGITTTTTNLGAVKGSVIGTSVAAGGTSSVTALDKQILGDKSKLITAQTLGFASDTKQKLLKQLQDGFAVVLSVAGKGNIPEANQDFVIDALVQELLSDVGSSILVPSGDILPPAA